MITSSITITRPANAVAYSVNDVINSSTPTILTFGGLAGNDGIIAKVRVSTNAITTTARLRLHLYELAPAIIADNDPNTILQANFDAYIGAIDLPNMKTEGAGSTSAYTMSNDTVAYANLVGARIYGVLQTLDAFTPVSGQEFKVEITIYD